VYTGYTLVCVRCCRALSLLRAAVLLRGVSEEFKLSSKTCRSDVHHADFLPFATHFMVETKKIYLFLDASCERCSRPIKPVFAPAARGLHRLHFGLRTGLSRALPTSCSSCSTQRLRGVGVELKNPSKRRPSCIIITVFNNFLVPRKKLHLFRCFVRALLAADQARVCASGTPCTQATLWCAWGAFARSPYFARQLFSVASPRSCSCAQISRNDVHLAEFLPFATLFGGQKIRRFLDASCERCSWPIELIFGPVPRGGSTLHFGMHGAPSDAV